VAATSGSIEIDGVPISSVPLSRLRSALSIIPQEPVLFQGTIRYNLDPFDEHDDQRIWEACEHAHVKDTIQALPLGLAAPVVENGENLSVGERQLICIARALLRRSRIIVMDEASASIDTATDALIQSTIRTQFQDCTIFTIAHRLHTIMDSTRVMVLDGGRVSEFDTPEALLARPDSIFCGLAREAGLVDAGGTTS